MACEKYSIWTSFSRFKPSFSRFKPSRDPKNGFFMIFSPLLLAVFGRVLHVFASFIDVFLITTHFFGERIDFIGNFSKCEALSPTRFKLGITYFQTEVGELV